MQSVARRPNIRNGLQRGLRRIRLDEAIANSGFNYVGRYINHLPKTTRLSILEAARQSRLAPDPVEVADNVQVKVPGLLSRPFAAAAYIQKFRTFATKFSFNFHEEHPLVVHSELLTRFSDVPLDPFLSHHDGPTILQFILQGCCPTLFRTKAIHLPHAHDTRRTVKAVKRLRPLVGVSEQLACKKCPHRGQCPWASIGVSPRPRFVYLIRILSGMHLTCLSFLKAPELRLSYNPFELQGYMKLIDVIDKVIEESYPHLSVRALNIPSWMRSSVDLTDEVPLTRKQRYLLKRFRRVQKEDAAPEGFIDELTGAVVVDEKTRGKLELKPELSLRAKRQIKKLKDENENGEFVWIQEPDPSKTEFGESINVERELDNSELNELRKEAFSESAEQRQTTSRGNSMVIDIDDDSDSSDIDDKLMVNKRFRYLMDFRGDVRGASSVQQALYQNYLKAVKASVEYAEPEKTLDLSEVKEKNLGGNLEQLVKNLNQPEWASAEIAESNLEINPLPFGGYSTLSASPKKFQIVHSQHTEVKTGGRYLDLPKSKPNRKQRKLIGEIWDEVERNSDLPFIRKYEFDYPNQTSSGSQTALKNWRSPLQESQNEKRSMPSDDFDEILHSSNLQDLKRREEKRRGGRYSRRVDEVSLEELGEIDSAIRMNQKSGIEVVSGNDEVEHKIKKLYIENAAPKSTHQLKRDGVDQRQDFPRVSSILPISQSEAHKITPRLSIRHSKSSSGLSVKRFSKCLDDNVSETESGLSNNRKDRGRKVSSVNGRSNNLSEVGRSNNLSEGGRSNNLSEGGGSNNLSEGGSCKIQRSESLDDNMSSHDQLWRVDRLKEFNSNNQMVESNKTRPFVVRADFNRDARVFGDTALGVADASGKTTFGEGRSYCPPDPEFEKTFRRRLDQNAQQNLTPKKRSKRLVELNVSKSTQSNNPSLSNNSLLSHLKESNPSIHSSTSNLQNMIERGSKVRRIESIGKKSSTSQKSVDEISLELLSELKDFLS